MCLDVVTISQIIVSNSLSDSVLCITLIYIFINFMNFVNALVPSELRFGPSLKPDRRLAAFIRVIDYIELHFLVILLHSIVTLLGATLLLFHWLILA